MDLVAIKTAMLGPAVAHIDLIKAAALGIVEGLTEYLPVSSTGHLLLMEHLFGWGDDAFGKSFAVLIQLGAILALLSIYFGRLWALVKEMFTQWAAARFIIGILLAFLPAAVIGALGYHIIKTYLFDVRIVCVSLIVGGFILLWVDRLNLQARYHEANAFSLPMYFGIGVIQCISMIPGVSRAGATIVGAMLFGADRRSAAEFSFWLAMPTMVGAFAYEVYKSRGGARPWRQYHGDRGRLRLLVHLRMDRREDVPALCAAPLLRALRMVAHPGWRRRARCAVCIISLRRRGCEIVPSFGSARDKTAQLPRLARVRYRDLAVFVFPSSPRQKRYCRHVKARPGRESATASAGTAKTSPAFWQRRMELASAAACARSSSVQIA